MIGWWGRIGLKSQLFGSIMSARKRFVAILALSSCPPDFSLAFRVIQSASEGSSKVLILGKSSITLSNGASDAG